MVRSLKHIKKALVIDDEVDICLLIGLFLRKKGILPTCAYSLKDGVSKALEIKPDWIFLDNNLPDGEGLQRIKELKKLSPLSKIIMITSFDGIKKLALSIGANKFIEKPFSFKEIETALI